MQVVDRLIEDELRRDRTLSYGEAAGIIRKRQPGLWKCYIHGDWTPEPLLMQYADSLS